MVNAVNISGTGWSSHILLPILCILYMHMYWKQHKHWLFTISRLEAVGIMYVIYIWKDPHERQTNANDIFVECI